MENDNTSRARRETRCYSMWLNRSLCSEHDGDEREREAITAVPNGRLLAEVYEDHQSDAETIVGVALDLLA